MKKTISILLLLLFIGMSVPGMGQALSVSGSIQSTAISGVLPGTVLYGVTNENGLPTDDGFRFRWEPNFFGSFNDALLFQKTDANNAQPDAGLSGFAFVNTGNTGILGPNNDATAMVIKGNGRVGWEISLASTSLEASRSLAPGCGQFSNHWAGYFQGDVFISCGLQVASDAKLKKDIGYSDKGYDGFQNR